MDVEKTITKKHTHTLKYIFFFVWAFFAIAHFIIFLSNWIKRKMIFFFKTVRSESYNTVSFVRCQTSELTSGMWSWMDSGRRRKWVVGFVNRDKSVIHLMTVASFWTKMLVRSAHFLSYCFLSLIVEVKWIRTGIHSDQQNKSRSIELYLNAEKIDAQFGIPILTGLFITIRNRI